MLRCATSLEVRKKYIEEHLDFGFYGFRYLLIPKLAIARDDNGRSMRFYLF